MQKKTSLGKWGFRALVALLLAAGAVYGLDRYIYSLSHESTDDAYISGTIVPISAEVKGKVAKVLVKDNQFVGAGDPLLEIIQEDYAALLKEKEAALQRLAAEEEEMAVSIDEKRRLLSQSQANSNAARIEKEHAKKELGRYEGLFKEELVSRSQYDSIESRFDVAGARHEAAMAAVAQAEAGLEAAKARLVTQRFRLKEAGLARDFSRIDLRKTMVAAPVAGRVARKNVDKGKYVQPGQTLLSIVRGETWVIANFKETQLARMAIGQTVEITADAYPGLRIKGRVDSIQPGTGAVFSLLPPENATGNFVKVVQRIPVKITLESPEDPDQPLWPGLSVVPTVKIGKGDGPGLLQSWVTSQGR